MQIPSILFKAAEHCRIIIKSCDSVFSAVGLNNQAPSVKEMEELRTRSQNAQMHTLVGLFNMITSSSIILLGYEG